MKKGWKKYWITCAAVSGAGLLLCIIGVLLGGTWDVVQANAPSWISLGQPMISVSTTHKVKETIPPTSTRETKTFTGIRKIDIEANALDLRIIISDTTNETIDAINWNNSNYVEFSQDKSTLKINTLDSWKTSKDIPEVRLYISPEHFDEVDIDIHEGYVYIQELRSVEILDLNVDAGKIVVDNFIANQAEFSCGAGNIQAVGYCGKEINIECGTGEIVLDIAENQAAYHYEVECGLGQVNIGNSSFSGNVEKELHSKNASKKMHIECGIGNVSVNFKEE